MVFIILLLTEKNIFKLPFEKQAVFSFKPSPKTKLAFFYNKSLGYILLHRKNNLKKSGVQHHIQKLEVTI